MYFIRSNEDGTMVLHQQQPTDAGGYTGPIGPLPQFMVTQVNAWRALTQEDAAGTPFEERVRPGFAAKSGEPVLVMQAVPLDGDGRAIARPLATRACTLIFERGPMLGKLDMQTAVDSFTDVPEWARRVIGVERLEPSFLARWGASGNTDAAEAFLQELAARRAGQSERRTVELFEPEDPPVAGDVRIHDDAARDPAWRWPLDDDHETRDVAGAAHVERWRAPVGGRRVAGGYIDEFDMPSRDEL